MAARWMVDFFWITDRIAQGARPSGRSNYQWLHEQGASVIITGGMGIRARTLFAENGIDVVVGAPVEEPETVARAFLEGTLQTGDNICDH